MTDVIRSTDLLASETLAVSVDPLSGVTISCEECGKTFAPATPRHRFCENACRQSAHRKSPAHRAYLDTQKERRLARRNRRFAEMNRDRSLSTLSIYSGSLVNVLPLRLMPLHVRRKMCDVILNECRVPLCEACTKSNHAPVSPKVSR